MALNANSFINDLQLYRTKQFASEGLVEENHISTYFQSQPELVDAVVSYAMMKSENYDILSLLTGGLGSTKVVYNREFEWDIHGNPTTLTDIYEDCYTSLTNGELVGQGGNPFQFKLRERWFEISDNIVFDDETQARVQDIIADGDGYKYIAVKTDPNLTGIDSRMLKPGKQISKDFSSVEEYSEKGGSNHYHTPFKMRNQLITLRKTEAISRSAATTAMVIELPDPKNPSRTTKIWTNLQEWTTYCNWMKERAAAGMFGLYNQDRSNRTTTLTGANGRPVHHAAGIRQQIAPANRRRYNTLTYGGMMDFFTDLSYEAKEFGGGNKFLMLTGFQGMLEFDRALKREMNQGGLTITDGGTFITGDGQELTFKGQFKTVIFPNDIEVVVSRFDPYDNIERFRNRDPKTKRPLMSKRFTVMNIDRNTEGKSNIVKVTKADSENKMWYVDGSISPFEGTGKKAARSSGKDGYEVHYLTEEAYMIRNPLGCGELIPDELVY